MRIFLSYSHDDRDIVARIQERLERQGIEVWWDTLLRPGTPSWRREIEQAIESCNAICVILTPSAKASEYVEKEYVYAQTCERDIYPILASGDEKTSIPFDLITFQYVDLTDNFEDGMRRLLGQVLQPEPIRIQAKTAVLTVSGAQAPVDITQPREERKKTQPIIVSDGDYDQVSLGDIVTFKRGKTHRKTRDTSGGSYPLYLSTTRVEQVQETDFDGEFVLLNAIVSYPVDNRPFAMAVSGKFSAGANVHVLTIKSKNVLPEYLAQYLAHIDLSGYIHTTGVIPYISIRSIETLPVIVPPLPEQKHLMEQINQLEGLRRMLEHQLKLCDDFEGSLFHKFFNPGSDI